MTARAIFFPEFDQQEIQEVIEPLDSLDPDLESILHIAHHDLPDPGGLSESEFGSGQETSPFDWIIRSVARDELTSVPLDIPPALIEDRVVLDDHLAESMVTRIRSIYLRPLVAVVNSARSEGRLVGESAEDRYIDFCRRWRGEFHAELLESYPLVIALRRNGAAAIAHAIAELVGRLERDRNELAEFCDEDVSSMRISRISGSGDTHNSGRSVAVIELSSGSRVVYKPRTVDGERGYEQLVQRLRDASAPLALHAPRVLQRDDYGYVEFIAGTPVTPERAPRFFELSGELGGILYCLNARDMHTENVVPAEDGPVPVDLETLLHPRRQDGAAVLGEVEGNAYHLVAESIYGVGVLPLVLSRPGAEDAGHLDVGFLGGGGRGASPYKALRLVGGFRDDLRVVLDSASPESPTPPGAPTPPATATATVQVDDEETVRQLSARFSAGFLRAYDWVLANREFFWDAVTVFLSHARLRYVHNPTVLYAQSLRMLTGTDALTDGAVHREVLKRIGIASKGVSIPVIASEVLQLARQDVPYFVVDANRTEIMTAGGDPVGAALAESPMSLLRVKLDQMGPKDRHLQSTLIASAFSALFPDDHLPVDSAGGVGHSPESEATDRALGAFAAEIGDHLATTVVPDRFAHLPPTWVGPLASYISERPWPPGVLGYDLYAGRPGPALALAALSIALDERSYRSVAEQIFDASARILSEDSYESRSITRVGSGLFTGMSGLLFSLAEAGRLLGEKDWQNAAIGAVPLVLGQLANDREPGFDVIRGRIGALAALHVICDGATVEGLGEALADTAMDLLAAPESDPALMQSGFAHGLSGPLFCLARWLPASELKTHLLRRLIGRLDDFFDQTTWDWRTNLVGEARYATGWCHGSSGISLALVACETWAPEVGGVADRSSTAIGNLVRTGFGRNLTFCHGDLGNRAVLQWVAQHRADEHLDERLRTVDRSLTVDLMRDRVHHRDSRYAHTDSLMVGSSGVALSLASRLGVDTRSPLIPA